MARVFILPEDESGRHTGRGESFAGVLAYALREAGPETCGGTENLKSDIGEAAPEMEHAVSAAGHRPGRRGPTTTRPVQHAILGWHPADKAWLTREHVAATVRAALAHMGLGEHQCVWVLHTDTDKPHVHLVINLVHPVTGLVARLGLLKKRMSEFCGDYERRLGDVRCKRRGMPKAANENRGRLGKWEWKRRERERERQPQKADKLPGLHL